MSVIVVELLSRVASGQIVDSFNPSPNNWVRAIAAQADGQLLVGGHFTVISGQPRNFIARLNSNDTLDPIFNQGVSTATGAGIGTNISCIAVQADGKILLGGTFTSPGAFLCRLNADGTMDTNFNCYANNPVNCFAVQPDGKILVGGLFTTLTGQSRNRIGRLNSNGSTDVSFNPNASNIVNCIAVQPDGKILVGGSFTGIGGQPRNRIARLNSNGSLDSMDPGANGSVVCLAVQADGKIIVGGTFTTLGGLTRNRIGRLNDDGTLDFGFDPGASSGVSSILVQTDGGIIVGGSFTNLSGQPRNYLGRLYASGAIDATFVGDASTFIDAVALQADGKVLVGGQFTLLGGQSRNYLGRFNNTVAATESLAFNGANITWLRGGSSPEVQWTQFTATTNGNDWVDLGQGTRIAGGWQVNRLGTPVTATVRAMGFLPTGRNNGSGSVLESGLGAPVVISQPTGRTNNFGSTAWFSALSAGASPKIYHWRKNGTNLTNGGSISGALTETLVLNNVYGNDTGPYTLVISNSSGSVTSVIAMLEIVDPLITNQPVSQLANLGDSRLITVGAIGTSPSYLWFKDGALLDGATTALLSLTNLQGSNAANYHVVVSNQFSSVTSTVAALTVNLAAVDSMNPGAVQPGNSFSVFSVAPQSDGGILLGGAFTQAGGQPRSKIARLDAEGLLDLTFNPGASDSVNSFAVEETGRILVAGGFHTLAGQARNGIGRINSNGSLDATFGPGGNYAPVTCIGIQADGKPVIGGYSELTRLNEDGTIDWALSPPPNGIVYCVLIQNDGKIIVGGSFTMLAGQNRNKIGRLNPNGSLDGSFNPDVAGEVFGLSVQSDGKILIGGGLTAVGDQPRTNIARLNPDGSVDPAFNPGTETGLSSRVNCFGVQADGKILVGGFFSTLGGQPRSGIGRLNPDGSLDLTFNPGGGRVYAAVLQGDGAILVGGSFSVLGGQNRTNIGRLKNTATATERLTLDGSTITWLRGGSSPEVWRTRFDFTTNGTAWSGLGNGERVPGGWQFTNAIVPPGATIRALGFVAGGYRGGSSWYVERNLLLQPRPTILANGNDFGFLSNRFGFDISAPSGKAVVVEATTNLVRWAPIHTNLVGNPGLFLFQDVNSGIYPRRFYRARFHDGVLPAPSFRNGTEGIHNGLFKIILDGTAGQTVFIESSTNLANWSPLATNLLGLEPFTFTDPESTNFPTRFYRARVQ